jgi:TRAP-type C4-dicarboxylate transport system substrate-binding protein
MKGMFAPVACVAMACAFAAPAHAADPIVLRLAYPAAPSPPLTDGIRPFAEAVEKDTGEAVKIQITIGPGLGNLGNIYPRTVSGVVDMSYGTMGVYGDLFNRTHVTGLPFVSEEAEEASVALWRLYKNGAIAQDFHETKPLALFTFGSSVLHTTKPIRSADDIVGQKIGAPSKSTADAIVLFGGAPVTISPPEYYQSVSRGLVLGVPVSWSGLMAFKLYEIAKYHTVTPFGLAPAYFVMNKDKFAGLPVAARASIDRHSGEALSRKIGKAGDDKDAENRDKTKAMAGHEIIELTPAERERWKKVLAPITESWIRATPNGAAILAAFHEEIARFRREKR